MLSFSTVNSPKKSAMHSDYNIPVEKFILEYITLFV